MHATFYNHKTHSSAGFTLVEMLAIAPIIVLVLATFIGLMINMTGDVLATSARNKMAYMANKSQDMMVDDVHRTVLFPNQSFTPQAPQGLTSSVVLDANGTSEPIYNGDQPFQIKQYNLILRQVATDKSPFDPARKIVRKANAPYACSDAANVEKNDPFLYDVIYFQTAKKIPPPAAPNAYYHRWFRRILFDKNSTPCVTPWQKPTCAKGQTGVNCKAVDQEWATEGYESGVTLPAAYFYFADIPEPKVGTGPGQVAYGQQWIHPFNDGTPSCSMNYYDDLAANASNPYYVSPCSFNSEDPYSPSSGKNAKAIHFSQTWMVVVSGKTIFYPNNFYAVRGGSL